MTQSSYKSLQYFIQRSQVLSLYKDYLSLTKSLNKITKNEIRYEIRYKFECYRNETNEKVIQSLLQDGKKELKRLGEIVNSSMTMETIETKIDSINIRNTNTWITESSDPNDTQNDIKGRVGTGWPWKTKKKSKKKLDLSNVKR